MTKDELQAISVVKDEKSTVKISGEIPFSYLETHRNAAIKHLSKDIEIAGFRKGHIPEKVLIERIGEMTLLGEMAERALSKAYPLIVQEHELDIVGYPQISITKLAKDNPLGFSAIVAIVPEVTLPDYKNIATEINKNKKSGEVTDEDVDKQIKDLLRQKAAYERLQEKAKQKTEAENKKDDFGEATELPTPETVEKDAENSSEKPEDIPLPELTDEYVQTLGQPGQFKDVADFKNKIKEHLAVEKEREVTSAHRAKITDAIVEETKVELPQVMIDAEINQMFAQMEEDLKRAQLKMDDYFSHIKKTKEDLKKEWTPAAEKRAKLQLALNEIAKKEAITPDKGTVDHEVSHLLEHYKDADESRVRVYVESMMTNDEVMKMLETL